MAEGLRDKEHPYKIKIFFKSSKLITIIILFLLFLAVLPFHENKFILTASFIALFGFIILSIYAISQIAVVTLNTEELWKRHINLFKNRIKKATKFSQTIKSNTEQLYKFINESDNKIQWLIPKESDYVSLKSLKEGTITKINVESLKKVVKNIKDNQKNKTDQKQIEPQKQNQKSMRELQEKPKYSPQKNKDITLHIESIGCKIDEGGKLLSYNKNIQVDSYKLQKQLNNALSIERTTVIDEVQMELENYKSMIKKYIEEENMFQFERYFELYFELAEEFLNQLSKPYSYEDAKRQMPYLDSSSSLLDWLRDHIMAFFIHAIKKKEDNQLETEKLDEITKIKWFSYRLINLSKNNKDHLFFQMGFSLWIRQLDCLSKSTNNFNKKEKIKDHFKFFENHLIPTVFFGEEITRETEEYAIYLLEMLRNIFDWILREDKKFEFLSDFHDRVIQIINNRSSSLLHFQESAIDMKRVFNEPQSYDSRKLQFLFGLGAYLDNLTRNESQIPDEKQIELDNIQDTIKDFIMIFFKFHITPFDLTNFLNVYPLMNEREVDNFWQWSFLNMPADGKLRQRKDNTKNYFIKLMLEFPLKEFNILKLEEMLPKTLSFLENLYFPTIDQELQNLEATDEKKQKIKTLLKKVSDYQHQKRVRYINEGKVDLKKKEEFISRFQKNFKESAYMRELFKNKKNITNIKNDFIWDINQMEFKSYFMSHEFKPEGINLGFSYPINFSDKMPETFSEGFSNSENKFLQSEILKRCEKKEISFTDFRETLINREWADGQFILVSNRHFLKIIKDSFIKIKENKEDNKNIFKYYLSIKDKRIPLKFDILIENQNINAVIFDKSKLPILEMFDPIDKEKELFSFEFLKDIGISIGIDAFSHNNKLMEFMIKNLPDWLTKKGNEKAQKEYLNQMVNIKISQGLHLNWQGIQEPIGESFTITK